MEFDWTKLPMLVQEKILALLPTIDLLKCRAVCKHWRTLTSSSHFLEDDKSVKQPSMALIISDAGDYHVLNNAMTRWTRIDVNFLINIYSRPLCEVYILQHVASDGGLLCLSLVDMNTNVQTLIVCNPVTKLWVQLPENVDAKDLRVREMEYYLPYSRGTEVHIVTKPDTGTYEVYMIGSVYVDHTVKFRYYHKYDSLSRSWCSLHKKKRYIPEFKDIAHMNGKYYTVHHISRDPFPLWSSSSSEPVGIDDNNEDVTRQHNGHFQVQWSEGRFEGFDENTQAPDMLKVTFVQSPAHVNDRGTLVAVENGIFFAAIGDLDEYPKYDDNYHRGLSVRQLDVVELQSEVSKHARWIMPKEFRHYLFGNESGELWGATSHSNHIIFHAREGHYLVAFQVPLAGGFQVKKSLGGCECRHPHPHLVLITWCL